MTISAVFFALFLLILWFVIGSRGHWILKALVIGLTLHLCVSVGFSLSGFAGWPSDERLPQKFIVHWIVVEEPDKETKENGAIYVWVTGIEEGEGSPSEEWSRMILARFFITLSPLTANQPRSHVVPYSKKKHEESEGIVAQIRSGKTVVGERGSGDPEDGREGEEGQGAGTREDGAGGGSFSQSNDITFHELPPPRLPKKIRSAQ
jgi:hypothetical protein